MTDPTKIVASDLSLAVGDPLLFRVRKRLRQKFGFRAGTDEIVKYSLNKSNNNDNDSSDISNSPQDSERQKQKQWRISTVHSLPINAKRTVATEGAETGRACEAFGNACFVTGSVGFALAAIVVREVATDRSARAFTYVVVVVFVVVVVVVVVVFRAHITRPSV